MFSTYEVIDSEPNVEKNDYLGLPLDWALPLPIAGGPPLETRSLLALADLCI
jgi:hypothetical protein